MECLDRNVDAPGRGRTSISPLEAGHASGYTTGAKLVGRLALPFRAYETRVLLLVRDQHCDYPDGNPSGTTFTPQSVRFSMTKPCGFWPDVFQFVAKATNRPDLDAVAWAWQKYDRVASVSRPGLHL